MLVLFFVIVRFARNTAFWNRPFTQHKKLNVNRKAKTAKNKQHWETRPLVVYPVILQIILQLFFSYSTIILQIIL